MISRLLLFFMVLVCSPVFATDFSMFRYSGGNFDLGKLEETRAKGLHEGTTYEAMSVTKRFDISDSVSVDFSALYDKYEESDSLDFSGAITFGAFITKYQKSTYNYQVDRSESSGIIYIDDFNYTGQGVTGSALEAGYDRESFSLALYAPPDDMTKVSFLEALFTCFAIPYISYSQVSGTMPVKLFPRAYDTTVYGASSSIYHKQKVIYTDVEMSGATFGLKFDSFADWIMRRPRAQGWKADIYFDINLFNQYKVDSISGLEELSEITYLSSAHTIEKSSVKLYEFKTDMALGIAYDFASWPGKPYLAFGVGLESFSYSYDEIESQDDYTILAIPEPMGGTAKYAYLNFAVEL